MSNTCSTIDYFMPSNSMEDASLHTWPAWTPNVASSHTEQQSHSCQHPFGGPLPGLKTESPDIGWSSDLGFIKRALVDVSGLLAVIGHGPD